MREVITQSDKIMKVSNLKFKQLKDQRNRKLVTLLEKVQEA